MNRQLNLAAGLAFLAISSLMISARAGEAPTRKALQAVMDRAAGHLMKKDFDGLKGMIAPGAKIVGPDGKTQDYATWDAGVRKMMEPMQNLHTVIHLEKFTVKGNSAVCTTIETDDYTMSNDKGHKYHEVSGGVITVTNRSGEWLATKLVFSRDRILRDGKVYEPKP